MAVSLCKRENSRCVLATNKATNARSDALDDNRSTTDENENGMKAAGSVMKAAGGWTKRICTVRARHYCARAPAYGELFLYVLREGSA